MSKQDRLNWSTDLLRIAWFLQQGSLGAAKVFIERGKKMYPNGEMMGKRTWAWWMREIQRADRMKAAERALTWSSLLK